MKYLKSLNGLDENKYLHIPKDFNKAGDDIKASIEDILLGFSDEGYSVLVTKYQTHMKEFRIYMTIWKTLGELVDGHLGWLNGEMSDIKSKLSGIGEWDLVKFEIISSSDYIRDVEISVHIHLGVNLG